MTETIARTKEAELRRFRWYPKYKDSGVEWLGEIPAHWSAKRMKFVAPARISKLDAKPDDAVYVGLEHVESRTGRLQLEAQPEGVDSVVSSFATGDVLFGKLRPYLAKAARPSFNGVCTTEILPLRPSPGSLQSYVMYCLLNAPHVRWLDSLTYGARMPRVNAEQVGDSRLPAPPESEQRDIADFLDRETAKIDALMANKERLIELLQEKRTALITRVVTRGLDANVPMKDSGVEWLGEVPAHWEVRPLKSMSNLQTGLTLGKRYEGEAVTTRPYLRVANVQDGYLALDDISEVEVSVRDAARFELRMGDVLVTEGGDFDKLGRGHVWEEQIAQCLHQNHIFAVRPRRTALTPHFLALVTSSGYGRAYFTATSKQSTNLASTNATKLRDLPVALPGLAEQVEIVHWASHESARIDGLVTKIEEAIDHLNELRTALISAAVTGKIDVREAASQ